MFPVRQSSYRQGHSTETAVLCVYNDLVRSTDEPVIRCSSIERRVLLDLSAAFDSVDHSILLCVLKQRFGVRGTPLLWFRSYLSDHTQSFFVGGTVSTPPPVLCLVPQGSSGGPIEFIAYTEDVSLLFERLHVRHHLYADDMQARCQSLTWTMLELCCRIASTMSAVGCQWLSVSFFFYLFPRLISAAADWMSTILPHMVWP